MATREYVRESVRMKVADHKTNPHIYDNTYYDRAIDFAISKVNFDFGSAYIDVPDVPAQRVFLVTKLASIEMCFIRAAEIASGSAEEPIPSTGVIDQIEVPDLSVSSEAGTTTDSTGAAFWLSKADRLQKEYDGEKPDESADATKDIETAMLMRTSLTNGGFRSRKMDPGLDAVSITATIASSDVTLAWGVLRDVHFSSYQIYRGESPDMSDETQAGIISDNHVVTFTDSDRPVGTYYYRVKTVNPNGLKTDSNTVAAAVS